MNPTKQYTVYVKFPDQSVEELDVAATSDHEARAEARKQLDADYEPGGKIIKVEVATNGMIQPH